MKCPTYNSLSRYNIPLCFSIANFASSSLEKWINPKPFEIPLLSTCTLHDIIDPYIENKLHSLEEVKSFVLGKFLTKTLPFPIILDWGSRWLHITLISWPCNFL